MSRNKEYEARQKAKGLEKVTLWLPSDSVSEFKLAARVCCEYPHLSINTLRDVKSGKFVSLERAVTGDN